MTIFYGLSVQGAIAASTVCVYSFSSVKGL